VKKLYSYKNIPNVGRSIEERCIILAKYIVTNKATVRATAKYFNISKSTVHKDVTLTLKSIEAELYAQVKQVLETNKSERHIRGGEATRQKYMSKQSVNSRP
jgi:putative DeoR family transcriptional regulator (stage III sporulation protein D)